VLIQQYLDECYVVEYSIPSCRRLLNEAGLSYQKSRQTAAESDVDEREPFREGPEKRREMDATVGSVDQTERSVHVKSSATLFPCRSRPSVEFLGQRGWMLSGATTGDGDHFSLDPRCMVLRITQNISVSELYNGTKIARSSFRRSAVRPGIGRHCPRGP